MRSRPVGSSHSVTAGELPADSAAAATSERVCRNCGAAAPGAYCPACGQETQARLPKFTQFLREAAGRYVALDGRLWRTLGGLLFRPGFLTREYLAGRRRRYIRPARLFLVTSLFLFAVLHVVVELKGAEVIRLDPKSTKPADAAERAPGAPKRTSNAASDDAKGAAPSTSDVVEKPADDAGRQGANEPLRKRERDGAGLTLDDDFDVDLGIEIPTLKKRLERFRHLSPEDRGAQIVDGIFRYGPYAMFVLLPAFGLLLKMVYLGRRRRYPDRPRLYSEHLVFAAYNTAFLSLAIIAATVAPFGVLRAAVIVWIFIYLAWSMRVVYGGPWLGIAARGSVIVIAYTVLFGLVTAGLVVAAVVLR